MSIPRFDKEMDIIQKLSNLPNDTSNEGLSAEALKKRFDQAGLLIQSYLNDTLIPKLTAENIPFMPVSDIDLNTVQAAIEYVRELVREVSAGSIDDRAISKAKLTDDVVKNSYGGVPYKEDREPDVSDDDAETYPVGRIWLCPSMPETGETRAWLHLGNGSWWPFVFDPAPDSDNMFMQYIKGKGKVWTDKETAIANLGSLRIATGKYTGTGAERTLLPDNGGLTVTPQLLLIHANDGPAKDANGKIVDNPVTLAPEATAVDINSGYAVRLVGNALSFYDYAGSSEGAEYANRKDVTYTWTAIY